MFGELKNEIKRLEIELEFEEDLEERLLITERLTRLRAQLNRLENGVE